MGWFITDVNLRSLFPDQFKSDDAIQKLASGIESAGKFISTHCHEDLTKCTPLDLSNTESSPSKPAHQFATNRWTAQGHFSITHGGYIYSQLYNLAKIYSKEVLKKELTIDHVAKTRMRYKKPTVCGEVFKYEVKYVEDLSKLDFLEADNFTVGKKDANHPTKRLLLSDVENIKGESSIIVENRNMKDELVAYLLFRLK